MALGLSLAVNLNFVGARTRHSEDHGGRAHGQVDARKKLRAASLAEVGEQLGPRRDSASATCIDRLNSIHRRCSAGLSSLVSVSLDLSRTFGAGASGVWGGRRIEGRREINTERNICSWCCAAFPATYCGPGRKRRPIVFVLTSNKRLVGHP